MEVTITLTDEQVAVIAGRVAALLAAPGDGAPAVGALTVAEAARRAGVSERTIRRAVAAGALDAIRLEGVRSVRIPAAAVESWAAPAAGGGGAPRPRRRKAAAGRRVLRDALDG